MSIATRVASVRKVASRGIGAARAKAPGRLGGKSKGSPKGFSPTKEGATPVTEEIRQPVVAPVEEAGPTQDTQSMIGRIERHEKRGETAGNTLQSVAAPVGDASSAVSAVSPEHETSSVSETSPATRSADQAAGASEQPHPALPNNAELMKMFKGVQDDLQAQAQEISSGMQGTDESSNAAILPGRMQGEASNVFIDQILREYGDQGEQAIKGLIAEYPELKDMESVLESMQNARAAKGTEGRGGSTPTPVESIDDTQKATDAEDESDEGEDASLDRAGLLSKMQKLDQDIALVIMNNPNPNAPDALRAKKRKLVGPYLATMQNDEKAQVVEERVGESAGRFNEIPSARGKIAAWLLRYDTGRKEVAKMFTSLQRVSKDNLSAHAVTALENAYFSGSELQSKDVENDMAYILKRIRWKKTPPLKRIPLQWLPFKGKNFKISSEEETGIAIEQLRALTGQLTEEEIKKYRNGPLRLLWKLLQFAAAAIIPEVATLGGQVLEDVQKQQ